MVKPRIFFIIGIFSFLTALILFMTGSQLYPIFMIISVVFMNVGFYLILKLFLKINKGHVYKIPHLAFAIVMVLCIIWMIIVIKTGTIFDSKGRPVFTVEDDPLEYYIMLSGLVGLNLNLLVTEIRLLINNYKKHDGV